MASTALHVWSWLQLMIILLMVSYMFGNIAMINHIDRSFIFWYGGFVFLSVYAITDLMDRNFSALVFEIMRCIAGLGILYIQGDWFGAGNYSAIIKFILAGYFIFSVLVTGWFVLQHKKEDKQMEGDGSVVSMS